MAGLGERLHMMSHHQLNFGEKEGAVVTECDAHEISSQSFTIRFEGYMSLQEAHILSYSNNITNHY